MTEHETLQPADAGPLERTVRRVAEAWRAWRRRRYWTQARHVEHLRTMLLADHRWLAADKTADALTERYLAALAPDWYARQHEDTARAGAAAGLRPWAWTGAVQAPRRAPRLLPRALPAWAQVC